MFATLETRKELEPKYVPQLFLGSLLGGASVSFWSIVFPITSYSPISLRES